MQTVPADLAFVGLRGSGKTALIDAYRRVTNQLGVVVLPTPTASFQLNLFEMNEATPNRGLQYSNCRVVVLVFDEQHPETLDFPLSEIESMITSPYLFIVGTHSEQIEVENNRALQAADFAGAQYVQVSSLANRGVQQLFERIGVTLSQPPGANYRNRILSYRCAILGARGAGKTSLFPGQVAPEPTRQKTVHMIRSRTQWTDVEAEIHEYPVQLSGYQCAVVLIDNSNPMSADEARAAITAFMQQNPGKPVCLIATKCDLVPQLTEQTQGVAQQFGLQMFSSHNDKTETQQIFDQMSSMLIASTQPFAMRFRTNAIFGRLGAGMAIPMAVPIVQAVAVAPVKRRPSPTEKPDCSDGVDCCVICCCITYVLLEILRVLFYVLMCVFMICGK